MAAIHIIRTFMSNQLRDSFLGSYISRLKRYKEEFDLITRSKIFVWSFKPAEKKLKDVPIIYFADIVRFPTGVLIRKYPKRYIKLLINFWKYRKNIQSNSWSSLSMIYHRPLILWYYYLLFWWAEYCGVLPELLDHPDRSLIPELFIRYIVQIDSIIDRKGGEEYLLKDISFIKRNCEDILKEMLAYISNNNNVFHPKNKRKLSDKIWKFRRRSLLISRYAQCQPELDFDDMLDYKDKTAGELFRVWVDLLCNIYDVGSRAENSKKILGLVAMAIQVIDDMLDSPVDYRDDVSNIFIHLLMETTDEFNIAKVHFEHFPYDHLDWVWANKYLPSTCKKAVDLITYYIEDISALSENQNMTTELCEIIEDWRLLNPEGQAEPVHEMSKVIG